MPLNFGSSLNEVMQKPLNTQPAILTRESQVPGMSLPDMGGATQRGYTPTNKDSVLEQLYKQLQAEGGDAFNQTKQTVTNTTRANPSPALEATINDWITKSNKLSADTAGAYTGYQNTYTDIINSLREMAMSQGSRQASAAGSSALASGLSPLEAQGAAQNTWRDVLSQMLSGVANYKGQQAKVGVDAQAAQKDILSAYGSFVQGAQAPYLTGLAGTENRQVTEGYDPTKYYTMLANIASGLGQEEYQRGQLMNQAQGNQIQAQQALWQYLAQQQSYDVERRKAELMAQSQQAQAASSLQQALGVANLQGQYGMAKQDMTGEQMASRLLQELQVKAAIAAAQNQTSLAVANINNPETDWTGAGAEIGHTLDQMWTKFTNLFDTSK